jgi:hypothetical protein
MTKKDFILIANVLADKRPNLDVDHGPATFEQWADTVVAMGNALRSTNPRFDRGRFFEACGLKDY